MARKASATTPTPDGPVVNDELKAKVRAALVEIHRKDPETRDTIFIAGDRPDLMVRRYISTRNPVLDRILGGGVVSGVPIEIFGDPGRGKTTTALGVARTIMDEGGYCVYLSSEQVVPPIEQMKLMGIAKDDPQFIFVGPQGTLEDMINKLRPLILTQTPLAFKKIMRCFIIDSIALFTTNEELTGVADPKKGASHTMPGHHARAATKLMRIFCAGAIPIDGTLILINQFREKIGTGGGKAPPPDTAAGRAIKYAAKTRIQLKENYERSSTMIDSKTKKRYGMAIEATVVKNNVGKPYERGVYVYTFANGLDKISPVYDEAVDYGVIERAGGSWWWVPKPDGEKEKLNGAPAVVKYLRENPEVFALIEKKVIELRETNPNVLVASGDAETETMLGALETGDFSEVEDMETAGADDEEIGME